MQLPTLLLYKKELQQNAILYFLPLPFAIALIYLKVLGFAFPSWMSSILGLAIPFTLAVAYGLQGFDVEEDAQTRDFLLVKPLSLNRIVGEKFILGLGLLLCWVIIAIWGAAPKLSWPSVFTIDSWVPGLVIIGSIITYSASFFSGLWISGPKKLLAASAAGIIGLSWGFLIFSSMATFIIHSQTLAQFQFAQEFMMYLTGIIITTVFVLLQLALSIWFLLQRPRLNEYLRLGQLIGVAVFIPIFAIVLNFAVHPAIRSAYFYGSELFGIESPLWISDGVWQPNSKYFAVACDKNRIGLGQIGEKPALIFDVGQRKKDTLKDLSWSPDGSKLAFVLENQVYYMTLKERRPIRIGKGYSPCWSHSSNAILFAYESIPPKLRETSLGRLNVHTVDLYKADLKKSKVELVLRVQSLSQYWGWDSVRNLVLFMDPFGRIAINQLGKVGLLPLPSFPLGKEGIFWSRFYSVPGEPNKLIFAAFSMEFSNHNTNSQAYNVRFYSIDTLKKSATLVGESSKHVLANLILNPQTGEALWGQGSTYIKSNVFAPKEVNP